MKKLNDIKDIESLVAGELYLFLSGSGCCPSSESLWGIYDRTEDGVIYLESSTLDMRLFDIWHPLPEGYFYSRLATRSELRDYMYNLGCCETIAY
ncbi:MAG: hypothetical protein IKJ08_00475 [Alistipes sp.]|nr:hypothetical protein [Alistipes sp.]